MGAGKSRVIQTSIAVTTTTTQTSAGADTVIQQSAVCTRWLIQNNSNANLYVEFDAVASTASTVIPPNAVMEEEDFQVTNFHFFTVAATNINAANGITLKMWR